MSFQSRVNVDVVFHESDGAVFTVGSVSDHRATTSSCETLTGSLTAEGFTIQAAGVTSLSTLALKNTGTQTLRIVSEIDVPAGRVAVLPTTSSVTVQAPGGSGQYTAVWVG